MDWGGLDLYRTATERLGKKGVYLARVEWGIFLAFFIGISILGDLNSLFTWKFYLVVGLALLGLSATGYWRRRIERKQRDRLLP